MDAVIGELVVSSVHPQDRHSDNVNIELRNGITKAQSFSPATEKLWIDGDGRTWRKKTVPVLRMEKSRDQVSFGHSRAG